MTKEIKADLNVWLHFLNNLTVYCRPFIDFTEVLMADTLEWYSNASGTIGFCGYHKEEWFQGKWGEFLNQEPSIEYQELYGVATSILLWADQYKNKRISLYCDNQAIVAMINNGSSSCMNCMKLIRIITLRSLELNVHIFAKYVSSAENDFSDALSRFQMDRFWRLV